MIRHSLGVHELTSVMALTPYKTQSLQDQYMCKEQGRGRKLECIQSSTRYLYLHLLPSVACTHAIALHRLCCSRTPYGFSVP
jgi:hypothetical protein